VSAIKQIERPMRFAYADPPYLGCGALYAKHHPEALIWDNPETHRALIQRICDEYPDGWALSMASTNLWDLLPMCPREARVAAWCKPFAIYKPNVPVAYTWEPVIFMGGRRRGRDEATVRDHLSCPITLKRGMTGAKPRDFCRWVFDLLGAKRGDALDDLFPGSGAVAAAWAEMAGEPSPLDPTPLEAWCLK
jgi:hypothetical protein